MTRQTGYGIFAHSCNDGQDRLSLPIVLCILFTLLLSPVTVVYAAGTPKRIISLAPSMTEILFALGLGNRVVGVTSFCDYPEEAKKISKIGGMSNPSLEAVVSLKPDIVVMTTDGNPKEFNERLSAMKINTYVFRAKRIGELPQGIRELGNALGAAGRADEYAKATEAALQEYPIRGMSPETKGRELKDRPHLISQPLQKKKVLFILWPEPLIVAGPGTVIDDALTLIGAANIASKAEASYPKYSIEEILRQPPDIIFIGKGTGMAKVSEGLLRRLKNVPAIRSSKVYYVSDNLYRLGPRTVMGIEEIAALMEKQP